MDAQLRQRLIGAAVLVGLAVIFLPLMLNSPTPVAPTEVSLQIPEPPSASDGARVLPLDEPEQAPEPAIEAPVEPSLVDRPAVETLPSPDVAEDVATSVVNSPTAPSVERPPITPAAKPEDIAEPPTAVVRAPAPVPAAAADRYFINFGSYAQEANARSLVAQLGKLGIKATFEAFSASGKTLYKVHSGRYADRGKAENARLMAKQNIANLVSSVAEFQLPSPTASLNPTKPELTAFAVQLGVFSLQAKANGLKADLMAAHFAAFVEKIPGASGAPNFRVRVGPESSEAAAIKLRDAIKTKMKMDAIVVSYP
jgi:DedD protein